jgi:hypothetical protein
MAMKSRIEFPCRILIAAKLAHLERRRLREDWVADVNEESGAVMPEQSTEWWMKLGGQQPFGNRHQPSQTE